MFYILTKSFHEKWTFNVDAIKTQKLVLTVAFRKTLFLFFTQTAKSSDFFKQICEKLECEHISAKFISKLIIFVILCAYAPRSQS